MPPDGSDAPRAQRTARLLRRLVAVVVVVGAASVWPASALADTSGDLSGTVTDTRGSTIVEDICLSTASATDLTSHTATVAAGSASGSSYTLSGLGVLDLYTVTAASCTGSAYDSQTSAPVLGGADTGPPFTFTHNLATISGTVSDPDGLVGDVCVSATPHAGGTTTAVTAGSGGSYSIGGLEGGQYDLSAMSCPGGNEYSATPAASNPVTATDGDTATGNDITLTRNTADITGTVSDPDGLVGDVCVSATPDGGGTATQVQAGAGGGYDISGLHTGDYDVTAQSCNGSHEYAATPLAANPVSVSDGATASGNDITLTRNTADITGTITDPDGSLVETVCVSATPHAGGTPVTVHPDSNGNYDIAGLHTGDYDVSAKSCSGDAYSATALAANPVSVTDGDPPNGGNDITLTRNPASLSGTITDQSTGQPLSGICVTTTPSAPGEPAITDSSGSYAIDGIPAGTYTVTAKPCVGTAYVTTAVTETVTWGQSLDNADVALPPTPPTPPAPPAPSPSTQTATSSSAAPSLNHYSADTTPVVGTLRMLTGLRQGLGPIRLRLSTSARRLARHGWLKAPFTWTVAGRLRVYGTTTKVVRDRHGHRHRRTVTVLNGRHYRATAGSGVVGIAVTKAGHKLLRKGRRVTLTITAIFTPADGDAPVAAQARTRLRRR